MRCCRFDLNQKEREGDSKGGERENYNKIRLHKAKKRNRGKCKGQAGKKARKQRKRKREKRNREDKVKSFSRLKLRRNNESLGRELTN